MKERMSRSRRGTNLTPPRSILPRGGSQPNAPRAPSRQRSKVGHGRACLACRRQRARCSSDKPCTNCVAQGIECRPWETKRTREVRLLESLQHQNGEYEQLLHDIGGRVGVQDAQRIKSVLGKCKSSTSSATANTDVSQSPVESGRPPSSLSDEGGDEDAEYNISDFSSLGSLKGADRIEEDLNRDDKARATGFIGKSSEISWLQRVGQNVAKETNAAGSKWLNPSVSAVDYHLDDLELNIKRVDLYELPPRLVADSLLDTYFVSVHPSFPILQQASIVACVEVLYDETSPQQPDDTWLAMLQLLFAVAAKCSYTTTQSLEFDRRDHVNYFSRATKLFVDRDVILRHPNLQEIQFLGLLAFYLLSVGHVNRSWKIFGLSIRSAFALGLNLKDTTPQTASDTKEERYRIWWSLFIVEHFLVAMTGRHSYITESCHTTPLPLPFEEDALPDADITLVLSDLSVRKSYLETPRPAMGSKTLKTQRQKPDAGSSSQTPPSGNSWLQAVVPSGSLYFLYFVKLSLIAHEARNRLYAPTVTERSWGSIEQDIDLLQLRTGSWLSSLPDSYDFYSSQRMPAFRRERLSLAFLFHSIKIMLARPCLCRFDRQQSSGPKKESATPKKATQCVESACSLLKLIPEHVDAMAEFMEFAPWWCLSHYIMQAAVVLLLELSMRSKHLPGEEQQITDLVKRALTFLQQISAVNLSADRCWRMCDWFVRRLVPWISLDTSGLPYQQHFTQDKNPDAWTTSILVTPSDEFLPFDPNTGEITGSFFPAWGASDESGWTM